MYNVQNGSTCKRKYAEICARIGILILWRALTLSLIQSTVSLARLHAATGTSAEISVKQAKLKCMDGKSSVGLSQNPPAQYLFIYSALVQFLWALPSKQGAPFFCPPRSYTMFFYFLHYYSMLFTTQFLYCIFLRYFSHAIYTMMYLYHIIFTVQVPCKVVQKVL